MNRRNFIAMLLMPLVALAARTGSARDVTVLPKPGAGQRITGQRADLIVMDDPIRPEIDFGDLE